MDIDDRFAQISYWLPGAEKPETLSLTAGGEETLIPVALCRRTQRDVWTYGKEALQTARQQEGVLVDRLLSRALFREQVTAGGEIFEATALLALFIKRSLSLLGGLLRPEKADFFMFTFEKVDKRALELTERIAMLLSLPPERVSCQSRAESFFYYNINQPEELWRHLCMICDFGGQTMKTLVFEANHHTRPATVTIHEQEQTELERRLPAAEGAAGAYALEAYVPGELTEERKEEMDEAFLKILQKAFRGKIFDTIYLIGDGFEGGWYRKSLSLLCANRRVFQGNNLYSKGACYGGMAKSPEHKRAEAQYVYLGDDMLKVNIGLEALRRGEEVYLALLDAGMNWFDARGECEFLLDADRSFSLRLTPVSGHQTKQVIVTLEGVPERPARTTRIHLTVSCPDADTVKLRMEDLGFGDFFPSSGHIWEETFVMKQK